MPQKNLNVAIPVPLHERLKRAAKDEGRMIQTLTAMIIKEALDAKAIRRAAK